MIKAFTRVEATEKVPYDITAFDAWCTLEGKFFIVCWDKCHTGIYKLKSDEVRDSSSEAVDLIRSMKNTTPKPITQVCVLPDYDLFLGLSDGDVHVISLTNGQVLDKLMKNTKVLSFAVDCLRLKTKADQAVRVCVATKKKLCFFQYSKKRRGPLFVPTEKPELLVPSPPRGVAWLGDSIITCLKRDQYQYTCISYDGDPEELFPAGSLKHDAIMLPLPTRELAVMVDTKMIVLNIELRKTAEIQWSEPPLGITYSEPYYVAVLPSSCVEVKCTNPQALIQKLMIDRVRLIGGEGLYTFVTNNRDVFYLEPTPYVEQCDALVNRHKMYSLALSVAELIPETRENNTKRKTDIKEKFAFHLFAQNRFKDAIKKYRAVEADPLMVIALFPNLLPADKRKEVMLKWPTELPPLAGKNLEQAIHELVDYLNEIRRIVELGKGQSHPLPERWEERDEDNLLTLIDTTTLKCYLKTNPYMAGPFVRRRGASIDLHEGEKCLKREGLYEDLVELYCHKRENEKALQLLHECHSNSPAQSLLGTNATVDYLQLLGKKDFPLIKKYAKWVLEKDADAGLKIFTDRSGEATELDRQKVVWYLEDHSTSDVVQQYLEHVIHVWKDTDPALHNNLVKLYRTQVEDLMSGKGIAGTPLVKAGTEPGMLGKARKKLLQFLESSKYYLPETLISEFPQNKMFEEYAILLRRLRRHEAALTIYAHFLKDSDMALEHCRKATLEDEEGSTQVYHTLIGIYISPPKLDTLDLVLPPGCSIQADINKAIEILNDHYGKIDTVEVLKLLPDDTGLDQIDKFLKLVFQGCSHSRRQLQVLRGLTYSQHLQVQRERIASFDEAFLVTDDILCVACNKKLGGAFTRTADGRLHHMYCEL